MKILFIYPDLVTGGYNFCPAIHILSAVVKKEGCQADMLHVNNNHGIPLQKNIIISRSAGYDLFAFTSTSFDYKYANQIAGWLKEAYPHTMKILGGAHATTSPEDFESSNFDIFCVGEGEQPMIELINAWKNHKTDWVNIKNLITRGGVNPLRGFLKDLDSLPFRDFDITDTEKILKLKKGWMSITFSRGCPYDCSFCFNHLYKKMEMGPGDKMSDYVRRRSPENTVSELESLAKKYTIKFFNTDDDLLVISKKWLRKFTTLYTERIYKPFGIKYIINARATDITDETARLLASSGCHEVKIGVETGNETLRKTLLNKNISNAALKKAFTTLHNYGVRTIAFNMMGIPGESSETFYDTLRLIIKLKPNLIRMTYLYPYKHTKIYDYCVEKGLFRDKNAIDDNRDTASPLIFECLTDEDLFLYKFLFPWYVNILWFNSGEYWSAVYKYRVYSFSYLLGKIPEIIEMDRQLSKNCKVPHYRYFANNNIYFELNDNIKNTLPD